MSRRYKWIIWQINMADKYKQTLQNIRKLKRDLTDYVYDNKIIDKKAILEFIDVLNDQLKVLG